MLSYIFILHQTTTGDIENIGYGKLSYIFILHQTTTVDAVVYRHARCLISLFYIKPQLRVTFMLSAHGCLISLFYIKPQLSRWTATRHSRCLISLFYIKPQHILAICLRINIHRYDTDYMKW